MSTCTGRRCADYPSPFLIYQIGKGDNFLSGLDNLAMPFAAVKGLLIEVLVMVRLVKLASHLQLRIVQ
jgi:hypothetical protein